MRFRLHLACRTYMIAAVLLLAASAPVLAQSGTPPRPPPRPVARPPATPTQPSQPRATRPIVPSDDADLDPDHPPMLPPASRAKMHACGREWQDMKRRGADRNQTWRQFATICLQKN